MDNTGRGVTPQQWTDGSARLPDSTFVDRHGGEQRGASNILEPGRSEMRCVLEGQGTGDCLFQLTPITDEAFKKVVFLPVTIIALERVVPLRLDEVVALDFYTDGTGGGVDPSALHGPDSPGPPAGAAGRTVLLKPAWAAAVVARHRDGSRALLGAAGGLVADFPGEASKGDGAGTSYSAEEIAILWATVWLLAALGAGDWSTVARFTFHTDSMPARDVAVGAAGAKGSRNSGTILRDAYRALQEALHGDVRLEYVPSHVGHPWNELVDRVAAAAGGGAWPSASPVPALRNCESTEGLAWLWLRRAPSQEREAYPQAVPGVPREEIRSREDLLAHMRVPSGRDPVSKGVRLRLGTANVLTSLDIDRTPAGHRRARDAGVRVTGRAPC